MCQLHSKLQQADIEELQLPVEGQGMPIDVPSVHSTLKCLHPTLSTIHLDMLPDLQVVAEQL